MTLPPGLQAVRERADKATAGPWFADHDQREDGADQVIGNGVTVAFIATPLEEHEDDTDFIAHSRTDVPALLDLVETLAGALAKVRVGLESNCDCPNCRRAARAALDKYREFGE